MGDEVVGQGLGGRRRRAASRTIRAAACDRRQRRAQPWRRRCRCTMDSSPSPCRSASATIRCSWLRPWIALAMSSDGAADRPGEVSVTVRVTWRPSTNQPWTRGASTDCLGASAVAAREFHCIRRVTETGSAVLDTSARTCTTMEYVGRGLMPRVTRRDGRCRNSHRSSGGKGDMDEST
jgi:hypothetical protein